MYNVEFIELSTTLEIDNYNIFEEIREKMELGTKQSIDLYKNFNPFITVEIFLHIDFKTGKILGFETESYSESVNCVSPTFEDYKRLIGEWNKCEEDELDELQYRRGS